MAEVHSYPLKNRSGVFTLTVSATTAGETAVLRTDGLVRQSQVQQGFTFQLDLNGADVEVFGTIGSPDAAVKSPSSTRWESLGTLSNANHTLHAGASFYTALKFVFAGRAIVNVAAM